MNLSVLLKKLLHRHSGPLDTIVCIYTCEKHRAYLSTFYNSVVGQYLKGLSNSKMIEVYADPEIHRSYLRGTKLVLRTQEKYEALSLKTLEMMKYCTRHFEFKHLVKIDVTTTMTHLEGKEYERRLPIDMDKVLQFLKNNKGWGNYDGIIFFRQATRQNAENWAKQKGLVIDYQRIFGDGPMAPFFNGKCYVVSHRFAQYISQYGRPFAEEHFKYFPGAEDLMVGRIFQQFQKTIGLT